MTSTQEILKSLIIDGEAFTYKNFASSWSEYGYPLAYSKQWVIWKTRVETVIKAKFGEEPIAYKNLKAGLNISILGNGPDKFENAMALILGALYSAEISVHDNTLKEIGTLQVSSTGAIISNKVFIVHGHDEKAKNELEIFLREIGLDPVVLHRQPDEG